MHNFFLPLTIKSPIAFNRFCKNRYFFSNSDLKTGLIKSRIIRFALRQGFCFFFRNSEPFFRFQQKILSHGKFYLFPRADILID